MKKTMRFALALLLIGALLCACGGNRKTEDSKMVMEFSYVDLIEIKDKFWNLWVDEIGKLSEAECYGTSANEEESNKHYLKVATDCANEIAENNKDIPVGEKIIITGYIEGATERDQDGFFVRNGDGKILFYLKHNAEDSKYDGFLCTTDEEIFLDLEDNTPIKIEAVFLKPDIIGSDNDLYDCKIIE